MFLMVTWSCGERGEEWWALSLMSLSMLLSGIALERALLCLSLASLKKVIWGSGGNWDR